jgi:hypothetical protein
MPSSLPTDAKYWQILYLPFKDRKNEGREVAIITVIAGISMTHLYFIQSILNEYFV